MTSHYNEKYLQCTLSDTRLLTAGGTSFDAIQRYEPICLRSTLIKCNVEPLYVSTEKRNKGKIIEMLDSIEIRLH